MPEPQPPAVVLEIDGRTSRFDPNQDIVIGRGGGATIVVAHPDVSRRHVRMWHAPQGWLLVDLGSSNGTWCNGARVTSPLILTPGMQIRLGGPNGSLVRVGFAAVAAQNTGDAVTRPASQDVHPTASAPRSGAHALPSSGNAGSRASGSQVSGSSRAASSQDQTNTTAPIRLPRRTAKVPVEKRHVGQVFDGLEDPALEPHVHAANTAPGHTVVSALPQVVPKADGAITVGRGQDNDIVLRDLLASRQHARLDPIPGGFNVSDLGSRNGTFINGHRISAGVLGEGDLLAVGRAQLTVRDGLLVASQDEGNVSFVANHLSFTLPDGKKLLDDISFALDGKSLVAVIGPSGAGKSTLLKALIGQQKATEGDVFYDGRDLYQNYDDLRQRIGVVPQDDVVHHQLTVRQALRYAAELRFPDDLPKPEREARVEEVIDELGLTKHANTQVSSLSGGQRKRTSVALELLTKPSLLFLDEPTSGLDPGLDKRLMEQFRTLADGGRTVVVITHNVASLSLCDHVLLLAPGGKVAYFGPPNEVDRYFQTTDYADIFNYVTDAPDDAKAAYARSPQMQQHVARPLSAPRPQAPAGASDDQGHRQQSLPRQLSTLIRRQFRAMSADRGFMLFSLLMPIALGALTFLVPDTAHGLAVEYAEPGTRVVPEARQIITLLTMGAVFMGLSVTIRELVTERPIFMRERAVGLSSFAYLTSKVLSATVLLVLQCAVMVGIAILAKGMPNHPVLLGNAAVETYLGTLATALTSMALGLLLSSAARTGEQIMPMLVIAMMGALVFSGVLFALNDGVLKYLSVISPSRWGMNLTAQSGAVDLETTVQIPQTGDLKFPPDADRTQWWIQDRTKWLLSLAYLGGQFVVCYLAALILTKRRKNV